MTVSSLSPAYTKVLYGTGASPHIMILPMIPAVTPTPGVFPDIVQRDTNPIEWSTYMDTFLNLLKPFFNTGTDFSLAEFWSKPAPESDPIFICADNPAISGSSATAAVAMSQVVMTFRTTEGGIFKLYLMEGISAVNTVTSAPYPAGVIKNLSDHLVGSTAAIVGRDGGYPLAPLRHITKTNDALRKKLLLNT